MLFSGRGSRLTPVFAATAMSFLLPLGSAHALDPRFELDARELDSRVAPAVTPVKAVQSKAASRSRHRGGDGVSRYTVKQGDHLYRILMHEYGFTEKQAEAVIPAVKRMNGIGDIRSLKVGSSIAIPLSRKVEGKGSVSANLRVAGKKKAGSSLPLQSYRLTGHGESVDFAAVSAVGELWGRLVPSNTPERERGVELGGDNFSLTIDPEQFPTLTAHDGATILVDAGGRLPPLVKSLVQERGEPVRIVSENPSDRKRFFASLLGAGGFFSVAEDFTVDFGADPQLTVTSDFKVEKSPDSLMRQELVLLNVTPGRAGTPPSLLSYLNLQGFRLLEPYPVQQTTAQKGRHQIHAVRSGKAAEIADRLISSLDIRYNRDSMIELYGPGDSGIRLDVRADRFFEVGGSRYVVSYFNGDPVFYTLMRLLQTRGYRVVILEDKDDFRRVAEKLAGSLGVGGAFGRHSLWPADTLPYNVRVSGYLFRNPRDGGKVLLTDREIDPLIAELATLNGYTVTSSTEQ